MTTRKDNIRNYYTKKCKDVYTNGERWEQAYYSVSHRQSGFKGTKLEFKNHMESQFEFGKYGWFNWVTVWEIDHIVPLCKGGEHSVSNLQILTKHDNRSKIYIPKVSIANL